MPRSSASETDRGQVHPLPALVAVVALALALTAYAGVTDTLVTPTEPSPAVPALKRVEAAATTGALLDPQALDHQAAALDGYRVNATLRTQHELVTAGPEPANDTRTAAIAVAVDASDSVVPGRLRVEVWRWTAA